MDDLDTHFHSAHGDGIQHAMADEFGAGEAAVGHELHYEGRTSAVGQHTQVYRVYRVYRVSV